MPDYNRIRFMCEKSSTISNTFVDDFLINLCAKEEGFEEKFARMLADYRDVVQKMPENWPMWLRISPGTGDSCDQGHGFDCEIGFRTRG
jgi:hypothetical protein